MEGFSLALLECQSYGVPMISYDIKYGPNELVKDGLNGYLIPKNDSLGCSSKYLTLLVSSSLSFLGIKYPFKPSFTNSLGPYYLIPKNDKEELTNKVKYLLEHPKLQQEFSKQSIALSQNYSKNNIIEKWDNALRLINN
jgi:poly(glycerol-phosphate) alpha-glucosyltransferase